MLEKTSRILQNLSAIKLWPSIILRKSTSGKKCMLLDVFQNYRFVFIAGATFKIATGEYL